MFRISLGSQKRIVTWTLLGGFLFGIHASAQICEELKVYFETPAQWKEDFGKYSSLLHLKNGEAVRTPGDWSRRRQEIKADWERFMGPWPTLLTNNGFIIRDSTNRDNFVQKRVDVPVARGLTNSGWLLVPQGKGPFPAVLVPYYEPESSIGVGKVKLRDFGSELARRGFVTLSIGSPGGDARAPEVAGANCQPLSFLGYIAANCRLALANLPEVDPRRIGIVGHSYGGKWAMFGACLDDGFACGVWSDPGIVFDEARSNVNYWEPWYLGREPGANRKPGVITADSPRTGPYREMMAQGRDLHELMALMAPRPFLVSGGSEDTPERWQPLNRVHEVYDLLGATNRVGMTNRPKHDPTEESNEQIYRFFECVLKPK
jgi:hypothetical protein